MSKPKNERSANGAKYIGASMTLGLCIGAGIGAAFDNVGIGIAFGLIFGIMVGANLATMARNAK